MIFNNAFSSYLYFLISKISVLFNPQGDKILSLGYQGARLKNEDLSVCFINELESEYLSEMSDLCFSQVI